MAESPCDAALLHCQGIKKGIITLGHRALLMPNKLFDIFMFLNREQWACE